MAYTLPWYPAKTIDTHAPVLDAGWAIDRLLRRVDFGWA
jgi:hypothetical protein